MAMHEPQRLDPETAYALLMARLGALGHASDFIDEEAAAALIGHAGESAPRLRAALASTLFLASTEDAPWIGLDLVRRALGHDEIPPPPHQPAIAPPPRRTRAAPLGARLVLPSLLAGLLVLDYLAWGPAPPPRPSTPAVATPRSTAAPTSIATRPVNPPTAVAPAFVQPAAPPAPAPPANVPEAALVVAAAPDGLSLSPPATVLVRFADGDPAAEKRAAAVAQTLRRAGIDRVVARPSAVRVTSRPIAYFYVDDLNFARKVTQILSSEPGTGFGDDVPAPKLALRSPGMPIRQPGLVEIHLP